MNTTVQLMKELDDRFDLLVKHHEQNIDSLNITSKINLQTITINKMKYEEKFKEDELLFLALEKVKMLGRAVGMLVN